MNPSKLHKIYLFAIAGIIALAVIVGVSWSQHVRDDAKRDAVIDAQKADITQLGQKIAEGQAAAQAQIAALEKQKQTVIQAPAQAPTIIREVLPNLQQTAPITDKTLPDAPSATLSKQDEVDLAQYVLTCKECEVGRDQLKSQVADQSQVIEKQKTELAAAMKAAKGGSVWQRTARAAKWAAIFGAAGYVAGKVH